METSPTGGRNRRLFIWVTGLAIAAILTGGCGKKGPPVPPGAETARPVADLKGEREGSRVRLTWSIPLPERPKAEIPARFYIYRNRIALDDASCIECPRIFERVGELPVPDCRPGGQPCPTMEFVESLAPGYRYRYKVRPVSAGGGAADDSNTVEIAD